MQNVRFQPATSQLTTSRLTVFLSCAVFLIAGCSNNDASSKRSHDQVSTLTEDGAWCWFQDPRAVYYEGSRRRTYTGWMTQNGQLVVAQLDHDSQQINTIVIEEDWDVNDHNTPSFLVRPDGHIMVFYARHNKVGLFTRRTSAPEDITAWEEEITVSDADRITYSHPVQLRSEAGKIYVFWRGPSWKPTFAYSTDGKAWSEPKILIQQQGREAADIRPYLKVVSDGDSTIHFAFTNGHPRNEPTNSVYYFKYTKGHFQRANGASIGAMNELPIDPMHSDRVYDANNTQVRAWIWDIALDSLNQPHIAYTRLPEENKHQYHYTFWDGTKWDDHFVAEAGGWFPQTPAGSEEREVHYSGGITFNQHQPSILYFSHEREGQFEISRAQTFDQGNTWGIEPITSGSTQLNVRPVFPHGYEGGEDHVLWMQGKYTHYTDYQTAIRFIARKP
ncbi:MAG: BNR-4 repeat-containing protein [Rhodothermales bacterium]